MTEYDACGRQLLSRLDTTNINPDDGISAYQWRCLQQALREECAATEGASLSANITETPATFGISVGRRR